MNSIRTAAGAKGAPDLIRLAGDVRFTADSRLNSDIEACPRLLRVSDAGQRHRRDIHQWPASESRHGKNPRGMGRGECRALRYGDLADAKGVSAGAPCPLRRFVTWQAGGDSSG